jgi:Bacterial Ig-like domain
VKNHFRTFATAATSFAVLWCVESGRAADVNFFSVSKGILFAQTNAAGPQLKTGLPYLFQASLVAETNGLSSATMQWPSGTRALVQRLPGGPYTYTDRQPTAGLLDLFYPNGDFTFTMNTVNDGPRVAVLTLIDGVNPPAPTLLNYAGAQTIHSSNNFTLQWGPFAFIHVRIDSTTGTVFRTAFAPGLPGALNGFSNSVVIPSNTLPAGRALSGRIIFSKVATTNVPAYPAATGALIYYTQTEFFLTTTGAGDVTPPRVVSSLPVDGATGVSTIAPFGFNFSEATRQNISFFINGTVAGRTFAWSPNAATLVVTPTSSWPPNTTIGWVLNPSDALPGFSDLNNNPLAPETTFLFTTGPGAAPIVQPLLADTLRLVDGRFRFKLFGETNRTYAAQASTNLVNWVSLGTNIAFGGVIQYEDTNVPALPRRFYRGLAP